MKLIQNDDMECFICGRKDVELRMRWFHIIMRRVLGWICRECLETKLGEEHEEWGVE